MPNFDVLFFSKTTPPAAKLFETHDTRVMRQSLVLEGDAGTEPRSIIHFIRPLDGERPLASEPLQSYLDRFDVKVFDPKDSLEGMLLLEQTREVATQSFDKFINELSDCLYLAGWKYEHWASKVIDENGEESAEWQMV